MNAPALSVSSRRWPWFWIGISLFLLGPAIYFVQILLKQLGMPWFVPLLATAGIGCMLASVYQRGGVWRIVAMLPFVLLCSMEWFMVLVAMRTPTYTGPVQPGTPLPTFSTTLADGRAFTNQDLVNGKPNILLFFRGRW